MKLPNFFHPESPMAICGVGIAVGGFALGGVLLAGCDKHASNAPEAAAGSAIQPAAPTASTQVMPATNEQHPAASPASKDDLRKKLTPEQYAVTCEDATEPAFRNAYWDNHAPGIYVDVITGKPLFSSLDKFDSGTGWPSFTKPLDPSQVVEKTDSSYGMDRTEVRSKSSDAHLGHVFDDGPAAAGGQRFCMNSASLRFIPVDKLKEEGYGEYLPLFEKKH